MKETNMKMKMFDIILNSEMRKKKTKIPFFFIFEQPRKKAFPKEKLVLVVVFRCISYYLISISCACLRFVSYYLRFVILLSSLSFPRPSPSCSTFSTYKSIIIILLEKCAARKKKITKGTHKTNKKQKKHRKEHHHPK